MDRPKARAMLSTLAVPRKHAPGRTAQHKDNQADTHPTLVTLHSESMADCYQQSAILICVGLSRPTSCHGTLRDNAGTADNGDKCHTLATAK